MKCLKMNFSAKHQKFCFISQHNHSLERRGLVTLGCFGARCEYEVNACSNV